MNDRLKRILPLLADALPEFLVILIGAACITGLWYLCFVILPFWISIFKKPAHKKTGVPISGFPGSLYSSSSQGVFVSLSTCFIHSNHCSKVIFDLLALSIISMTNSLNSMFFPFCGEVFPLPFWILIFNFHFFFANPANQWKFLCSSCYGFALRTHVLPTGPLWLVLLRTKTLWF